MCERVAEIQVAAHHQFPLIGLADVEVHGTGCHDGVEHRLDRLGHHGLQRVRLDRESNAGHRGQLAGMASNRQANPGGGDETAVGFHPGDSATLHAKTGHFALLDDVDATRVGGPRITPGYGVMAYGAATRLQQTAMDRKTRLRRTIQIWYPASDLITRHPLGVDAVQPHRITAAHRGIDLGR